MSKDLEKLFVIYCNHLKRSQYKYDHRKANIKSYLAYIQRKGIEHLTVDSVKSWIEETYAPSSRFSWERRYANIRDFSIWANAAQPFNEALPHRRQAKTLRRKPNILSEGDAIEIIRAIGSQKTEIGLSPVTVQVIFGLMFRTGLRTGEALALKPQDVDLEKKKIYVKEQKSPRDRYVPILSSTVKELAKYRQLCSRIHPSLSEYFFLFDKGVARSKIPFYQRFHRACVATGHRPSVEIGRNSTYLNPHDLRHSFAVNALIKCYKDNLDVFEEAVKLTVLLGHKNVKETYWYIENVPELVSLVMEKVHGA